MIRKVNAYFEGLDRDLGPTAQTTAIGLGGIAFTAAMVESIDFSNSPARQSQTMNTHAEVRLSVDVSPIAVVEGLALPTAAFLSVTLIAASGLRRLKQHWAQ